MSLTVNRLLVHRYQQESVLSASCRGGLLRIAAAMGFMAFLVEDAQECGDRRQHHRPSNDSSGAGPSQRPTLAVNRRQCELQVRLGE